MKVVVVGGGAAGFMAAITAAEAGAEVTLLEKGRQFLSKVKISGGGRCNVTHACFDPREFATRYPRGERELIGPLQRFGARETVEWFASRGVKLKTESDGRMFPVSDSSQTIIDCLVNTAKAAGVKLRTVCAVAQCRPLLRSGDSITTTADSQSRPTTGHFVLTLSSGDTLECDRLLVATGGCRPDIAKLLESLGHTLEPAVPSLFTFHSATPWLQQLAGITVPNVEVSAAGLRERGPLLITHTGLSGPAILRLSAWGARELHALDYKFPLLVNWLTDYRPEQSARLVVNTPMAPLPARLWEQLVLAAGIARETRWSRLTKADERRLQQQLTHTEFPVTGKSLNKEEFVTCGGVRLREVNFKTMESKVRPGLYFAGELLDIDGITGGFNFQAAWTTGWIAGHAMACAS